MIPKGYAIYPTKLKIGSNYVMIVSKDAHAAREVEKMIHDACSQLHTMYKNEKEKES